MTETLVRLPATVLEPGGLGALASCVRVLSSLGTVLVGPQRDAAGEVLDEFTIAAALRSCVDRNGLAGIRLGVAASVANGRAASIIAREATAAQLLGACDVLLLAGDARHAEAAATITGALFLPGAHTIEAGEERIDGAVNLPQPEPGRPLVRWHDAGSLWLREGAVARRAGDVVRVPAAGLAASGTATGTGTLVVVEHPLGPPGDLVAALTS